MNWQNGFLSPPLTRFKKLKNKYKTRIIMSISKVYDDDDGFSMLTYSYACVDPAFISLTYNLHSIEHSTARFFKFKTFFCYTYSRIDKNISWTENKFPLLHAAVKKSLENNYVRHVRTIFLSALIIREFLFILSSDDFFVLFLSSCQLSRKDVDCGRTLKRVHNKLFLYNFLVSF